MKSFGKVRRKETERERPQFLRGYTVGAGETPSREAPTRRTDTGVRWTRSDKAGEAGSGRPGGRRGNGFASSLPLAQDGSQPQRGLRAALNKRSVGTSGTRSLRANAQHPLEPRLFKDRGEEASHSVPS